MMHNEQKVTDSIYWIGANDFVTPRFDNLVPLPQGISYNTYFIDDEKPVSWMGSTIHAGTFSWITFRTF